LANILNVVIVLGRCQRQGGYFGIRLEEKGRGRWVGDWAFPVKERTAIREQFDRALVSGTFEFATGYPGCPACGAPGAFKCACGKVACWNTETRQVTCPWCGQTAFLGGVVDRLDAGGDG
jgi:hypothetical protein